MGHAEETQALWHSLGPKHPDEEPFNLDDLLDLLDDDEDIDYE